MATFKFLPQKDDVIVRDIECCTQTEGVILGNSLSCPMTLCNMIFSHKGLSRSVTLVEIRPYKSDFFWAVNILITGTKSDVTFARQCVQ